MKRILYAEDNEANREVVREYLQARGYEVMEAEDGAGALGKARERRPDLILLDIHMPGLDGYAVLRTLQQEPELSDVPVLAVTAFAMKDDRERALAAGFQSYLTKPLDLRSLLSEVQRWCREQ